MEMHQFSGCTLLFSHFLFSHSLILSFFSHFLFSLSLFYSLILSSHLSLSFTLLSSHFLFSFFLLFCHFVSTITFCPFLSLVFSSGTLLLFSLILSSLLSFFFSYLFLSFLSFLFLYLLLFSINVLSLSFFSSCHLFFPLIQEPRHKEKILTTHIYTESCTCVLWARLKSVLSVSCKVLSIRVFES